MSHPVFKGGISVNLFLHEKAQYKMEEYKIYGLNLRIHFYAKNKMQSVVWLRINELNGRHILIRGYGTITNLKLKIHQDPPLTGA